MCRQLKVAAGEASDAACDDGICLFWKSGAWEAAAPVEYCGSSNAAGRCRAHLRVRLRRIADGAPLTAVVAHLGSGSSAGAEALRLAELEAPTTLLAPHVLGEPRREVAGPSLLGCLREAVAANEPTLLCLDANSEPDRADRAAGSVWAAVRGVEGVRSVWEEWFDSSGAPTGAAAAQPVSTNKRRGQLSRQPAKVDEHACRLIDHVFYTAPTLALPEHAFGPVAFADEAAALAAPLPSLAVPSDHYPVVVDLLLQPAAEVGAEATPENGGLASGGEGAAAEEEEAAAAAATASAEAAEAAGIEAAAAAAVAAAAATAAAAAAEEEKAAALAEAAAGEEAAGKAVSEAAAAVEQARAAEATRIETEKAAEEEAERLAAEAAAAEAR